MSSSFWDDRYSAAELVYGAAPNDFLVQAAAKFPPQGRALDIGAGEGRNALFLAARGLDTLAVDQSAVGMSKAQAIAHQRGLALRTEAADLNDLEAPAGSFDVISSIFVHLPGALRATVHRRVVEWLRPGGLFVLEAYSPDQLKRDTGGPKDPALLAPLEVIVRELRGLTFEHQAALVRPVNEGSFHTGEASVVQVIARKSPLPGAAGATERPRGGTTPA